MSNIFGTDGVRSKVGSSLFVLENLPKLGDSIAKWAIKKYGSSSAWFDTHAHRHARPECFSELGEEKCIEGCGHSPRACKN